MSSSNGTNNTPAAPSWLDAGAAWAAPATGNDGAQVPAAQPPATRATAPAAPPSRPAAAPEDFPGAPPMAHAASAAEQARPSAPPPSAPSAAPPFHQGPVASAEAQAFRPAWEEPTGVLDSAIRERRSRPTLGWRHLAYELTGGRWNPGLSAAESRLREQMRRIKTPLPGPHSVLVSSIKGGVGKTTVSAVLGLALAEYQGKHVIAMDANPDAGTLGDRLVGPTQAGKITVRNLLDNLADIRSATDLSGYTHLAGRLHVLTSEQLPEPGEMFSAADYEAALRLVSLYFQAIVTDSGTGIMHSAMQGALHHADSLVIVAAPTIDAASRAESTFQWLVSHGYQHLTEDAVVVMSYDRHSPDVDDEKVTNVFRERCRAVVKLPPDPHLQAGGIIDFDALTPATRDAVLELAAVVAEGFQGRTTRGLANHRFRALPDTGGPR